MAISNKAMDFLKNEEVLPEKKVSVLEEFKDDIFYLKNNNIPITKIQDFLEKEHSVKTSYPNLLNWIKRQDEYKSDVKDESKNSTKKDNLNSQKEDGGKIEQYPDTEGGLKKHNLHDQIIRPKPIT
jgi:hypothetical protein